MVILAIMAGVCVFSGTVLTLYAAGMNPEDRPEEGHHPAMLTGIGLLAFGGILAAAMRFML